MSDETDVLASPIVERRRLRRRRSLLGAQIIFRNGNCLDISDTGALLQPLEMALCPNKFVLKPRFDPSRECEVVWRKGELLGVRYVSSQEPLRRDGGVTALEYAFIAGIISIAAVVGFTTIGTNLSTIFSHVAAGF